MLLCACLCFAAAGLAEDNSIRDVNGENYYPWTGPEPLPTTVRCLYLINDVTNMTECWTVPAGITKLDLNGHRL